MKKYTLLNDYHLLSYDELDSTNDEAKRLAIGGSSHGAVIWSKKQTNGRGRMKRNWVSGEGNLFISFLLSPHAHKNLSNLIFITCRAVQKSLDSILAGTGNKVSFKWPNDILLNKKKLGGMLMEKIEANGKTWIIVGIGINVESAPNSDEISYPATYIKECGIELVSAKILVSKLVDYFIHEYDRWISGNAKAPIDSWRKKLIGIGKMVEVAIPGKIMAGIFEGVDDNGNMILKLSDGRREIVTSADVFFSNKNK